MRLFLDITRIATRIVRSTPTGIDRTEFAYAREILFNRPDIETVPVITTPWFSGAISAGLARKVLSQVERSWQASASLSDDIAFERLIIQLQSAGRSLARDDRKAGDDAAASPFIPKALRGRGHAAATANRTDGGVTGPSRVDTRAGDGTTATASSFRTHRTAPRRRAQEEGAAQRLATAAGTRSLLGRWCNWQHSRFWFCYSRFES